jgi:hypothetical protein
MDSSVIPVSLQPVEHPTQLLCLYYQLKVESSRPLQQQQQHQQQQHQQQQCVHQ